MFHIERGWNIVNRVSKSKRAKHLCFTAYSFDNSGDRYP